MVLASRQELRLQVTVLRLDTEVQARSGKKLSYESGEDWNVFPQDGLVR